MCRGVQSNDVAAGVHSCAQRCRETQSDHVAAGVHPCAQMCTETHSHNVTAGGLTRGQNRREIQSRDVVATHFCCCLLLLSLSCCSELFGGLVVGPEKGLKDARTDSRLFAHCVHHSLVRSCLHCFQHHLCSSEVAFVFEGASHRLGSSIIRLA